MKSTWPVRSTEPCLPAPLPLAKNHRQTGIPVLRNNCVGSAIMQETRSALTISARMAPSPFELDDIEPLAITMPALPPGASFHRTCWIQAKLALLAGGTPKHHLSSSV